ncbi:hypothetical protein L195_g006990 [Trifolium pratense]|uniref:Uncharacterized protein n=1 Tax=Trifolium pratense TaxID=57577 RepID=A0A2K3P570_TRIPR|nr:hypothetical protein L195_g006990 [Trifolium pratense]
MIAEPRIKVIIKKQLMVLVITAYMLKSIKVLKYTTRSITTGRMLLVFDFCFTSLIIIVTVKCDLRFLWQEGSECDDQMFTPFKQLLHPCYCAS